MTATPILVSESIAITAGPSATGSTFFTGFAASLAGLGALALAIAVVGIMLAALRLAAHPTPDETASALHTIKTILIVTVFLGSLGAIIYWICADVVGVWPRGIIDIKSLFSLWR